MGLGFALILATRLAVGPSTEAAPQGTVETLVGAGDIASCGYTTDSRTAALLDNEWGTVVALGDNAYLQRYGRAIPATATGRPGDAT